MPVAGLKVVVVVPLRHGLAGWCSMSSIHQASPLSPDELPIRAQAA